MFQKLRAQEAEEYLYEKSIMETEDNLRDQNQSEGFIHQQQININKATSEDLIRLNLLRPEQIRQFLLFRKTFGDFISMAELQAIPYWDLTTIKQLLQILFIDHTRQPFSPVKNIKNNTGHTFIYRTGGKLIDSLGENSSSEQISKGTTKNKYAQLISYRFNSLENIQLGLTVEKDAGEKSMLDHNSGYLMMSKRGAINSLIVGDYVVNMGQGLIHWQGHAFGKSSNIIQGLKQAALFKPHTGTDENIFHRGAAISLRKYQVELSTFMSVLKIDANIVRDPFNGRRAVSSLLTSGLHRSESELADKDALKQSAVGGRLAWNTLNGKIGVNHIRFNYDISINKRALPYNKFAISGDNWHNTSIDCSWSNSFGLIFGEVGIDKRSATAMIVGMIKSFDPKFDLSLIVRNMSYNYKAIQSNSMTQQGEAGNEKGVFMCFNLIPSSNTRIEGFTDHYMNSWPLYYNDGVRRGQSYAIQYVWRPDKKNEMYIRWRSSQQTTNTAVEPSRTNHLSYVTSNSIRLHASSMIGEMVTLRYRTEIIWIKNEYRDNERGSLSYAEIIIKPKWSAFSISARHTVFETDSYASRVYAYERDVLSYHAIPAHYDHGNRSYIVLHYKLNKAIQLSAKCIAMNRGKQNPPYYINDFHNVKQLEWRMQLVWKIRS
ncbi:MAG: ComEA family DNA-binding protein [bacterium]